jgi:hypothetical protein
MLGVGADFRDDFFRQRRESGRDLDWGGVWTGPFLMSNVARHMFPDGVTRGCSAK